jgi:hypothetical protein
VILHALELAGRDLAVGMVVGCALYGVLVGLRIRRIRTEERERRDLAFGQARRLYEEERRDFCNRERRRTEMHSYNARPTATERWGGLV